MALKKEDILKYALQNAVKFNGKANPGAVIGKVLSEHPESKDDMKKIASEVNKVVAEVNKMPLEKQQEEFKKYESKIHVEKKEQRVGLPELKNVGKKVVMRMAPAPSGLMHIGHAHTILLSSEYCRMYKGDLLLRLEDTNPENIYPPAYDLLVEDAQWLTKGNIAKVIIQSDRMGYYYDYAEKLIDMGKAYVCTCDPDKFREMITKKIACPCRELDAKEQHKRYDKMFSEYKPGEAVMRVKTDINHQNPALRDFPAMRINDHVHPRQKDKYRVWPLMNFSVFVDDVEYGMTHIIRGKDHMDNAKKQEYLYHYFNKPVPETMFIGRINFTDIKISKTKTRKLIEDGAYTGWDDIRLPFLVSLRRRGYQPDAFTKYSLEVGLSQTDKTLTSEDFFKIINSNNRDIIDPVSNRYFFVPNPKGIEIKNAPEKKVELDLHPGNPRKGKRKFMTKNQFYITEDDYKSLKAGKLYRLMDCINFVKKAKCLEFDSEEYEKYKDRGEKIMHWLPVQDDLAEVELLMPDNTLLKGYAEPSVSHLKEGEIVQFERIGFCRLDKKEKGKLTFWFAHK